MATPTDYAVDALFEAAEKCVQANMSPREALRILGNGWAHHLQEQKEESDRIFASLLK